MPLPSVLQHMRTHLSVYLSPVTFEAAVAYIDGFNMACYNGILVGFREWLLIRIWERIIRDLHFSELGSGSNHYQPTLVLRLLFPGELTPHEMLRQIDQKRSIEFLFTLLEEFYVDRRSFGGLCKIYLRYHEWRKVSGPYGPESLDWISENDLSLEH